MAIEQLFAEVSFNKILLIAIIGAFLELDAYFIGMTIVSQPIIAGGIAGYILGDMRMGIVIGSVIQLIWLNAPPVGAYVPPSTCAITMTTVFIGIAGGRMLGDINMEAFFMFAMVIGVGIGYFVGQMDIWNRKFNTKIIHRFERKIKEGKESFVVITQLLAVFAKLFRDFILYITVFILGTVLAVEIFATMPEQIISGLKIAYWIMPAIGFAVVFEMFKTKVGAYLHGCVLVVGYLVFSFFEVNVFFYMLLLITVGLLVVYNTIWKKREA